MDSVPRRSTDLRPPGVLKRFVQRARYLQKDRVYCRAIAVAAGEWDTEYPAFAIGARGLPPDDAVRTPPGRDWFWPASLESAHQISSDRLRLQHIQDEQDERVYEAVLAWRELVLRLCRQWWPRNLYPSWEQTRICHPASWFVSASLLWDPRMFHDLAAREWIRRTLIMPKTIGYHPGVDVPPGVERERAAWNGLMQRLTAMLETEPALTGEQINCAAKEAWYAALDAGRSLGPDEKVRFHYVPVFAGMTSSDWRLIEVEVLEMFEGDLAEHARRLAAAGMSKSKIAGELGVDRRTVQRYLDRQ